MRDDGSGLGSRKRKHANKNQDSYWCMPIVTIGLVLLCSTTRDDACAAMRQAPETQTH